ncbi:MFS transporter [Phenylobacterium sp.]|uniref:MFS transporter n=1 Tax=Phenylobacterium sp. TaxID=1871053 RepID=UPI0035B44E08
MSARAEPLRTPQPLNLPVLYIGVVALLIAGLQPVVLGGLVEAGRLSVSGIGPAATVELLALGLACGGSAALLRPTALRTKLALAAVAHALCNLATLWVADGALIGVRAATGLFAGVMLWSTVGMISRSARPERQAGVFVTVQTLAQLLLAAVLPRTVMAAWGVDGALVALAAISVTAAGAALGAPRGYAPLPRPEGRGGGFSPLAWAGLAAVFLYMAFIVAIWVYLEPLAAAAGLPPARAHDAVAAALAMQVLGGLVATVAGDRLPAGPVLIGAGVINLGLVAALSAHPAGPAFIGLVAVFGFLWLFVLPFHTVLLIAIDPSRRAAMQLGAAQLLGSSAGPLAASLLVGDTDAGGAMRLAAACLVLALTLIVGVTAVMARRTVVPA